MIVKILDNKKPVEEACALLYEVYIEHGQWNFDPNNPSNLRVETKCGRNLLVNDFIDRDIWFGALDNSGVLLGCICISIIDEICKFEIDRYSSSELVWKHLGKHKSCVELMKLAVRKDYAGKGVMDKLLLAAFQYCEKNKLSVFTYTQNGYLKSFYERIEFPLIVEQAFKNSTQDLTPVNFYFANFIKDEVNTIIGNLKYFARSLTNAKYNILELLNIVAPIIPLPIYWHDTTGVKPGLKRDHSIKTKCQITRS